MSYSVIIPKPSFILINGISTILMESFDRSGLIIIFKLNPDPSQWIWIRNQSNQPNGKENSNDFPPSRRRYPSLTFPFIVIRLDNVADNCKPRESIQINALMDLMSKDWLISVSFIANPVQAPDILFYFDKILSWPRGDC